MKVDGKSLKCDVCLKTFPCKSVLTKHYRTHTGKKPFACQTFDKKFAQKCNLIQHQATYTGENLLLVKNVIKNFRLNVT